MWRRRYGKVWEGNTRVTREVFDQLEAAFYKELEELGWDHEAFTQPWFNAGTIQIDGEISIEMLEHIVTIYKRIYREYQALQAQTT
jgi:hypothetical protein